MKFEINSIRAFVGAKDYNMSRAFYHDLGFEESVLSDTLSLFQTAQCAFYLQDYYNQVWLENTMLFLEVKDVEKALKDITALELIKKFPDIKILPLKKEPWGDVFYIIDPAGVLLHVAQFASETT
jgi:catechol 2,3-dioxygenase-like lactoylglutathione lyase family enzyme